MEISSEILEESDYAEDFESDFEASDEITEEIASMCIKPPEIVPEKEEELDEEVVPVSVKASLLPVEFDCLEVTHARLLRQLLLAKKSRFPPSWVAQGFAFSEIDELKYGLVQHVGGPCGVIAVVQGQVIKYMFHCQPRGSLSQIEALCSALCRIIWSCANAAPHRLARVCLPPSGNISDVVAESFETFRIFSFTDFNVLYAFVQKWSGYFLASRGLGVILLVLSCILSRGGASAVMEDMDENFRPLIVEHGYCSQELVNLLLFGTACSNVFDGCNNEIGENSASKKNSSGIVLRGVPRRSEIGLLSHHEHFDYLSVGSHLKSPFFPVWVVCIASHYCVLFSKTTISSSQDNCSSSSSSSRFSLTYYDQLANQDEETVLTLDFSANQSQFSEVESPLEDTIRTKWSSVSIDWNGCDRIL